MTPAPHAPRSRRWWPWRFSLRTLLLAMTLVCLTLAPMLPELNRDRDIQWHVQTLEKMGGRPVFVSRRPTFASTLVRYCWPQTVPHLNHELLMADFVGTQVDLAQLARLQRVRGVCFNQCTFVLPRDP